jgi:flagellar biosynthetic protein FliR
MEFDFYNWFLVFIRTGAFLLALPFFSAVNIPVMLRIALAAFMSLLLAPQLPPFPLEQLDLISLVGLLVRETSIGLLLGFIARMIFFATELAANIIATELGLNMGTMLDPSSQQPEAVTGVILYLLTTVVMLTLNLHHGILLGFARTFEVLPLGGGHLNASLFEAFVGRTSGIFVIALQIAAPVMATSFVITVFFAVMSRAVPQMNVFSESFGFRIAGGLIVFGLTLQLTAQYVANHLGRLPEELMSFGHLIGGV